MLAICTADYEFTLVDIGHAGRQSDGGVYSNSELGYAIDNNTIDIPLPEPIPTYNALISFPYIFVADDMIKPFAKTNLSPEKLVCNYRISRSRRTIENTFGIAAGQFRIFRRPIIAKVETVIEITKAVVILHNYLMKSRCSTDANSYCPVGFTDRDDASGLNEGDWRRQ